MNMVMLNEKELREKLRANLLAKLQGMQQPQDMQQQAQMDPGLEQAREYQSQTRLADALSQSASKLGTVGGMSPQVGARTVPMGEDAMRNAEYDSKMNQKRMELMQADQYKGYQTLNDLNTQDFEEKRRPLELQRLNDSTKNFRIESSYDKQFQDLSKALNPATASPRSGIGAVNKQLTQIRNVKQLVRANPDLNLPSIMMRELATSVAQIVGGGVSSNAVSQIEHLTPKTLKGDLSRIAEWIIGDPIGAHQQNFVKSFVKLLDKEEAAAHETLSKAQFAIAQGYGNLLDKDPERYNRILLSVGIDPKHFDERIKNLVTNGPEKQQLTSDVLKEAQNNKTASQTIRTSDGKTHRRIIDANGKPGWEEVK